MRKSILMLFIACLISPSLALSQITQLWESPSSDDVGFLCQFVDFNKYEYYYTNDYKAKKITFYDATTFSQSFSIANSDSSYLYPVAIPDLNGNGYPDVILEKFNGGNITIRDLKTGETIYTISPPSGYSYSIYSIGITPSNNMLKLVIGKYNRTSDIPTLLVYSLGVTVSSSVNTTPNEIPSALTLEQNYPNPFNPSTVIKYSINSTENVRITIYNAAGQLLRELISSVQRVGEHTVTWDGKDNSGKLLSSGAYFYQIRVGQNSQARKMILLK